MSYFLEAWKKYNISEGRSSRAEFWVFYGITTGIIIGQVILATALYTRRMDFLAVVVILSLLVHIVPYFSLLVRRLHDIGLSGVFSLFIVVPYFLQLILQMKNLSLYNGFLGQTFVYNGDESILVLLVVVIITFTLIFGLIGSKPGMNKYGPNPKEVAWAKKMQKSGMLGQQFQNGAPQQFHNIGQNFSNEVQFQNGAPQQFTNVGQNFSNEGQFQNGAPQQFTNVAQQQFQSGAPQQFTNVAQQQFQNEAPQQFTNVAQQQSGAPQQFTNVGQNFSNEVQSQNGAPQQFTNVEQNLSNEVQFQSEAPQQFNNMGQDFSNEVQFQNGAPQQFTNVAQQSDVNTQEITLDTNTGELAKFEKMFQEGVLTQEEFEEVKRKLM